MKEQQLERSMRMRAKTALMNITCALRVRTRSYFVRACVLAWPLKLRRIYFLHLALYAISIPSSSLKSPKSLSKKHRPVWQKTRLQFYDSRHGDQYCMAPLCNMTNRYRKTFIFALVWWSIRVGGETQSPSVHRRLKISRWYVRRNFWQRWNLLECVALLERKRQLRI